MAVVCERCPAVASTPLDPAYCSVPSAPKIRNIASMKPKSPTRLVTNAFLPAVAAVGRSNQNEIRK